MNIVNLCVRLNRRARFFSPIQSKFLRFASTSAAIRNDPELYSRNCMERKYNKLAGHPNQIVELFVQRLALQKDARFPRERRNVIENLLGKPSGALGDEDSLRAEAQEVKNLLRENEREVKELSDEIESLVLELPNLTHDVTPRGEDAITVEVLNPHLRERFVTQNSALRDHVELGAKFELLDFTSAVKASGWGHCDLINEGGLLGQALIQYAISVATRHGFKYAEPSSKVYSKIIAACGFQPRDQNGEQQIYQIEQDRDEIVGGLPSHSLSGTAEIPFAAKHADSILLSKHLPLRIVGPSRCFRREAGARGRQTRGLYRLHEFTKVEMFAWTTPDGDQEVFDNMMFVQKEILETLGLWCRVLEMPSTDLGASAYRKRDIEVYFPSRADLNDGWGEVTSTSLCTNYQTRRLKTRMKSAEGLSYPHTVNGTALAVPRVLAALLECGYVEEKNIIKIPEVLWPWMHGITKIEKR